MNRYPRRGSGFDKARRVGRIAKRITQPPNGGIQAVFEIDERTRLPQRRTLLLVGDQRAWALEQAEQDAPRVFLQGDPHARLSELSRVERQLEC